MKQELNNKSSSKKYTNNWVIEKIREEIKKILEFNENENTTYEVWDTTMTVLKEKFIAMSPYIKNTERTQINNLMLHHKPLEKQEQAKPNTSRWRKIIQIGVKSMK
jgi:hypothetical protein